MVQILIHLGWELTRQIALKTLHKSILATHDQSLSWTHQYALIDCEQFTYKVWLVPIEVEEADNDDEEEFETVV